MRKKTEIPTKNSQLQNDEGYLKNHQDISGKLDATGDASNVTTKFTQAANRANLSTGEKFSVSLGKVMKYFADLKTVAFSGSYADLSNKPAIPVAVTDLSDSADYAKKSEIPDDTADLANGAGFQTSAQVNTAITGKGYQSAAQMEAAITGKGYQSAAQVDVKISTALSSAVEWKGNVATEAALPASKSNGDMYNITAKSSYGPAGTNVVWDGTKWDSMAGVFVVDAMTAEDILAICK